MASAPPIARWSKLSEGRSTGLIATDSSPSWLTTIGVRRMAGRPSSATWGGLSRASARSTGPTAPGLDSVKVPPARSLRGQPAAPGFVGQVTDLIGDADHVQPLCVADHRHDQSRRCIDSHSEVHRLPLEQAGFGVGRVQQRVLGQGRRRPPSR